MDTRYTHTHDQDGIDGICVGCYQAEKLLDSAREQQPETLKAFERARLERKYKAFKIRRYLM